MYKISTIHFGKRDKNHLTKENIKIKQDCWNLKSHLLFLSHQEPSNHVAQVMNISSMTMTTLTALTTFQLNHQLLFIATSDGTRDFLMCRVFKVTNIKKLKQLLNHVFVVSKGEGDEHCFLLEQGLLVFSSPGFLLTSSCLFVSLSLLNQLGYDWGTQGMWGLRK